MEIRITAGATSLEADLLDTDLAKKITELLPLESRPNRWGDEIYFSIPLEYSINTAQEEVEIGDLAYWPSGQGFCIFYGATPASRGNEPRAISEVEVFGRIKGDATVLRNESGGSVKIEKA